MKGREVRWKGEVEYSVDQGIGRWGGLVAMVIVAGGVIRRRRRSEVTAEKKTGCGGGLTLPTEMSRAPL